MRNAISCAGSIKGVRLFRFARELRVPICAARGRQTIFPRTRRRAIAGPTAILIALLCCLPARAQSAGGISVTDKAVADAVERGVEWLKSRQDAKKHWEHGEYSPDNRTWGGDTALVCLALLYAGQSPNEPYLSEALDWLQAQKLTGTYAVSLRAQALSLVPGSRRRNTLRDDLRWLVRAAAPRAAETPGAYGYVQDDSTTGWWDNSNSQYGVLGVWMATEAGLELSQGAQFWGLIRDHWLRQQEPDGGWGYRKNSRTTGSMTAAGLATLYVVMDRLQRTSIRQADPVRAAVERGLDWLGREFTPNNPHGEAHWKYYYLYGVERAGRASGRKYFRSRDWFREGAADLLNGQRSDGPWGGGDDVSAQRNTAFALLFLCHGRAPLLINKLETAGDWDVRPRDAAGLTWYAQNVLERLMNWQIVSLDGTVDDLLEAPILYWSGVEPPPFSPVHTQKIREHCERGGLLLAVANDGSYRFVERFRELARSAFPDYEVRPLPPEHPLFSGEVQYKLNKPPVVLEVHNGVRTLMLCVSSDVADSWNRFRARGQREADFQFGLNLYLYATDKGLKTTRLTTTLMPERQTPVKRRIRLGRVQYDGNWSIEPFGWTRLTRYLRNETGTQLLVSSGVKLDANDLREQFDVLHITGAGPLALTEAEQQGLRRFLTGGGTLIADAAGGDRMFTDSLEDLLRKILRTEPELLAGDAPLLTGGGLAGAVDLAGMAYRRAARARPMVVRDRPPLRAFTLGKRYAVIYSPLDLSVGLLGTDVYGCMGFEPASALQIMRNLVLYGGASAAEQVRLHEGG
jgi:hypothetical protein